MNFVYVFPTYKEARSSFDQACHDLNFDGKPYSADLTYLTIKSGSDTHRYTSTPVKVSIDTERINGMIGYLDVTAIIDEIYSEVTRELHRLMATVKLGIHLEAEYGRRHRDATSFQPEDAFTPSGSDARGEAELGTKITS